MDEKAEAVLARDFAGPAPNKQGASLRTACTADVKDIFDSMDIKQRGTLSKEGIRNAAKELGFPLNDKELEQAMREMDMSHDNEVSFPEFLSWWNSSEQSQTLRDKIFLGTRGQSKWSSAKE